MLIAGAVAGVVSVPALAGPEGENVAAGTAIFQRSGAHTTITTSQTAIIDYSSFDLSANESVRFVQPGASSRVLNRIESAMPTMIDGSVSANGAVYFTNPAGVIFGPNSVLNVGDLFAAAGRISNEDFLAGRNRFTDLTGEVLNYGSIRAHESIALLGRRVANFGTLLAPEGMITLAADDGVLIGQRGGRVFAKMLHDDGAGAPGVGAVENHGVIDAGGGQVNLGAGDHFALALGATSRLRGGSVRIEGGGRVTVGGSVDVSGGASAGGGLVEITGDVVALRAADIDASGVTGGVVRIGGDLQGRGELPNARVTVVDEASRVDVSATGAGDAGTAIVWSDDRTLFRGEIAADAGLGAGGFVEVSGKQWLGFEGVVDVSSAQGERGALLLDPKDLLIVDGAADGTGLESVDSFLDASIQGGGSLTSTLTDGQLNQLLLGGDVILRAENDILFSGASAIEVTDSAAGSSLDLRALRSIGVDTLDQPASVQITLGGDFIARANYSPGSDELARVTNRDAGDGRIFFSNTTVTADNAAFQIGAGWDGARGGGDITLPSIAATGTVFVQSLAEFSTSGTPGVINGTGSITADRFAAESSLLGGGSIDLGQGVVSVSASVVSLDAVGGVAVRLGTDTTIASLSSTDLTFSGMSLSGSGALGLNAGGSSLVVKAANVELGDNDAGVAGVRIDATELGLVAYGDASFEATGRVSLTDAAGGADVFGLFAGRVLSLSGSEVVLSGPGGGTLAAAGLDVSASSQIVFGGIAGFGQAGASLRFETAQAVHLVDSVPGGGEFALARGVIDGSAFSTLAVVSTGGALSFVATTSDPSFAGVDLSLSGRSTVVTLGAGALVAPARTALAATDPSGQITMTFGAGAVLGNGGILEFDVGGNARLGNGSTPGAGDALALSGAQLTDNLSFSDLRVRALGVGAGSADDRDVVLSDADALPADRFAYVTDAAVDLRGARVVLSGTGSADFEAVDLTIVASSEVSIGGGVGSIGARTSGGTPPAAGSLSITTAQTIRLLDGAGVDAGGLELSAGDISSWNFKSWAFESTSAVGRGVIAADSSMGSDVFTSFNVGGGTTDRADLSLTGRSVELLSDGSDIQLRSLSLTSTSGGITLPGSGAILLSDEGLLGANAVLGLSTPQAVTLGGVGGGLDLSTALLSSWAFEGLEVESSAGDVRVIDGGSLFGTVFLGTPAFSSFEARATGSVRIEGAGGGSVFGGLTTATLDGGAGVVWTDLTSVQVPSSWSVVGGLTVDGGTTVSGVGTLGVSGGLTVASGGTLAVASGSTVELLGGAERVSSLALDQGSLIVDGVLSASGARRFVVSVDAIGPIELSGSGEIDAAGAGVRFVTSQGIQLGSAGASVALDITPTVAGLLTGFESLAFESGGSIAYTGDTSFYFALLNNEDAGVDPSLSFISDVSISFAPSSGADYSLGLGSSGLLIDAGGVAGAGGALGGGVTFGSRIDQLAAGGFGVRVVGESVATASAVGFTLTNAANRSSLITGTGGLGVTDGSGGVANLQLGGLRLGALDGRIEVTADRLTLSGEVNLVNSQGLDLRIDRFTRSSGSIARYTELVFDAGSNSIDVGPTTGSGLVISNADLAFFSSAIDRDGNRVGALRFATDGVARFVADAGGLLDGRLASLASITGSSNLNAASVVWDAGVLNAEIGVSAPTRPQNAPGDNGSSLFTFEAARVENSRFDEFVVLSDGTVVLDLTASAGVSAAIPNLIVGGSSGASSGVFTINAGSGDVSLGPASSGLTSPYVLSASAIDDARFSVSGLTVATTGVVSFTENGAGTRLSGLGTLTLMGASAFQLDARNNSVAVVGGVNGETVALSEALVESAPVVTILSEGAVGFGAGSGGAFDYFAGRSVTVSGSSFATGNPAGAASVSFGDAGGGVVSVGSLSLTTASGQIAFDAGVGGLETAGTTTLDAAGGIRHGGSFTYTGTGSGVTPSFVLLGGVALDSGTLTFANGIARLDGPGGSSFGLVADDLVLDGASGGVLEVAGVGVLELTLSGIDLQSGSVLRTLVSGTDLLFVSSNAGGIDLGDVSVVDGLHLDGAELGRVSLSNSGSDTDVTFLTDGAVTIADGGDLAGFLGQFERLTVAGDVNAGAASIAFEQASGGMVSLSGTFDAEGSVSFDASYSGDIEFVGGSRVRAGGSGLVFRGDGVSVTAGDLVALETDAVRFRDVGDALIGGALIVGDAVTIGTGGASALIEATALSISAAGPGAGSLGVSGAELVLDVSSSLSIDGASDVTVAASSGDIRLMLGETATLTFGTLARLEASGTLAIDVGSRSLGLFADGARDVTLDTGFFGSVEAQTLALSGGELSFIGTGAQLDGLFNGTTGAGDGVGSLTFNDSGMAAAVSIDVGASSIDFGGADPSADASVVITGLNYSTLTLASDVSVSLGLGGGVGIADLLAVQVSRTPLLVIDAGATAIGVGATTGGLNLSTGYFAGVSASGGITLRTDGNVLFGGTGGYGFLVGRDLAVNGAGGSGGAGSIGFTSGTPGTSLSADSIDLVSAGTVTFGSNVSGLSVDGSAAIVSGPSTIVHTEDFTYTGSFDLTGDINAFDTRLTFEGGTSTLSAPGGTGEVSVTAGVLGVRRANMVDGSLVSAANTDLTLVLGRGIEIESGSLIGATTAGSTITLRETNGDGVRFGPAAAFGGLSVVSDTFAGLAFAGHDVVVETDGAVEFVDDSGGGLQTLFGIADGLDPATLLVRGLSTSGAGSILFDLSGGPGQSLVFGTVDFQASVVGGSSGRVVFNGFGAGVDSVSGYAGSSIGFEAEGGLVHLSDFRYAGDVSIVGDVVADGRTLEFAGMTTVDSPSGPVALIRAGTVSLVQGAGGAGTGLLSAASGQGLEIDVSDGLSISGTAAGLSVGSGETFRLNASNAGGLALGGPNPGSGVHVSSTTLSGLQIAGSTLELLANDGAARGVILNDDDGALSSLFGGAGLVNIGRRGGVDDGVSLITIRETGVGDGVLDLGTVGRLVSIGGVDVESSVTGLVVRGDATLGLSRVRALSGGLSIDLGDGTLTADGSVSFESPASVSIVGASGGAVLAPGGTLTFAVAGSAGAGLVLSDMVSYEGVEVVFDLGGRTVGVFDATGAGIGFTLGSSVYDRIDAGSLALRGESLTIDGAEAALNGLFNGTRSGGDAVGAFAFSRSGGGTAPVRIVSGASAFAVGGSGSGVVLPIGTLDRIAFDALAIEAFSANVAIDSFGAAAGTSFDLEVSSSSLVFGSSVSSLDGVLLFDVGSAISFASTDEVSLTPLAGSRFITPGLSFAGDARLDGDVELESFVATVEVQTLTIGDGVTLSLEPFANTLTIGAGDVVFESAGVGGSGVTAIDAGTGLLQFSSASIGFGVDSPFTGLVLDSEEVALVEANWVSLLADDIVRVGPSGFARVASLLSPTPLTIGGRGSGLGVAVLDAGTVGLSIGLGGTTDIGVAPRVIARGAVLADAIDARSDTAVRITESIGVPLRVSASDGISGTGLFVAEALGGDAVGVGGDVVATFGLDAVNDLVLDRFDSIFTDRIVLASDAGIFLANDALAGDDETTSVFAQLVDGDVSLVGAFGTLGIDGGDARVVLGQPTAFDGDVFSLSFASSGTLSGGGVSVLDLRSDAGVRLVDDGAGSLAMLLDGATTLRVGGSGALSVPTPDLTIDAGDASIEVAPTPGMSGAVRLATSTLSELNTTSVTLLTTSSVSLTEGGGELDALLEGVALSIGSEGRSVGSLAVNYGGASALRTDGLSVFLSGTATFDGSLERVDSTGDLSLIGGAYSFGAGSLALTTLDASGSITLDGVFSAGAGGLELAAPTTIVGSAMFDTLGTLRFGADITATSTSGSGPAIGATVGVLEFASGVTVADAGRGQAYTAGRVVTPSGGTVTVASLGSLSFDLTGSTATLFEGGSLNLSGSGVRLSRAVDAPGSAADVVLSGRLDVSGPLQLGVDVSASGGVALAGGVIADRAVSVLTDASSNSALGDVVLTGSGGLTFVGGAVSVNSIAGGGSSSVALTAAAGSSGIRFVGGTFIAGNMTFAAPTYVFESASVGVGSSLTGTLSFGPGLVSADALDLMASTLVTPTIGTVGDRLASLDLVADALTLSGRVNAESVSINTLSASRSIVVAGASGTPGSDATSLAISSGELANLNSLGGGPLSTGNQIGTLRIGDLANAGLTLNSAGFDARNTVLGGASSPIVINGTSGAVGDTVAAGSGQLTFAGATALSGASVVTLGRTAVFQSTVTLNGASSVVTSDGGATFGGAIVRGSAAAGVGTLAVDASTGAVVLGSVGAPGAAIDGLTITGQSVGFGGSIFAGEQSYTASSYAVISGSGSLLSAPAGSIVFASPGVLTLSAGTLSVSSSGDIVLPSVTGSGSLSAVSGGVLTADRGLGTAVGPGLGSVNLSGGTGLVVGDVSTVGGQTYAAGAGSEVSLGGTLSAGSGVVRFESPIAVLSATTITGPTVQVQGGARLSSAASNLTINADSALLAGGLTGGVGVLTVNGGSFTTSGSLSAGGFDINSDLVLTADTEITANSSTFSADSIAGDASLTLRLVSLTTDVPSSIELTALNILGIDDGQDISVGAAIAGTLNVSQSFLDAVQSTSTPFTIGGPAFAGEISVGQASFVAPIGLSSQGRIIVSGFSTAGSGSVTFDGTTVLGGGAVLVDHLGAAIAFNDGLDDVFAGATDLTLNFGGGSLTAGPGLGQGIAIGSLTVTSEAGLVGVQSLPSVRTVRGQTYSASNGSFSSVQLVSESGDIVFNNRVVFSGSSGVASGDDVTFAGAIVVESLGSVSVDAGGTAVFAGTLEGTGSVETTGGAVRFDQDVDGFDGVLTLRSQLVVDADRTIGGSIVDLLGGATAGESAVPTLTLIGTERVTLLGGVGSFDGRLGRVEAVAPRVLIGDRVFAENGVLIDGAAFLIGDATLIQTFALDPNAGIRFTGSIDTAEASEGGIAGGASLTLYTNRSDDPVPTEEAPSGLLPRIEIFGSIGQASALNTLNLNFSGATTADGIEANSDLLPGRGFVPVETSIVLGDADEFVATEELSDLVYTLGTFNVGDREKVFVLGSLTVNAESPNTARIGDITALGDLAVLSPSVVLVAREPAQVFDSTNSIFTNDFGTDIVAGGDITIGTITQIVNLTPEAGRPQFANPSGAPNLTSNVGAFTAFALDENLTALALADGNRALTVDVRAQGATNTNIATVLAGAAPRNDGEASIETEAEIDAAVLATLQELGINARQSGEGNTRVGTLNVNLPEDPDDEPVVSVDRLQSDIVSLVIESYRDLFLEQRPDGTSTNRRASIRGEITDAVDLYFDETEAFDFDLDQFVAFIASSEAPATTTASQTIASLQDLLRRVRLLGLTERELNGPKTQLFGLVRPFDIPPADWDAIIEGEVLRGEQAALPDRSGDASSGDSEPASGPIGSVPDRRSIPAGPGPGTSFGASAIAGRDTASSL